MMQSVFGRKLVSSIVALVTLFSGFGWGAPLNYLRAPGVKGSALQSRMLSTSDMQTIIETTIVGLSAEEIPQIKKAITEEKRILAQAAKMIAAVIKGDFDKGSACVYLGITSEEEIELVMTKAGFDKATRVKKAVAAVIKSLGEEKEFFDVKRGTITRQVIALHLMNEFGDDLSVEILTLLLMGKISANNAIAWLHELGGKEDLQEIEDKITPILTHGFLGGVSSGGGANGERAVDVTKGVKPSPGHFDLGQITWNEDFPYSGVGAVFAGLSLDSLRDFNDEIAAAWEEIKPDLTGLEDKSPDEQDKLKTEIENKLVDKVGRLVEAGEEILTTIRNFEKANKKAVIIVEGHNKDVHKKNAKFTKLMNHEIVSAWLKIYTGQKRGKGGVKFVVLGEEYTLGNGKNDQENEVKRLKRIAKINEEIVLAREEGKHLVVFDVEARHDPREGGEGIKKKVAEAVATAKEAGKQQEELKTTEEAILRELKKQRAQELFTGLEVEGKIMFVFGDAAAMHRDDVTKILSKWLPSLGGKALKNTLTKANDWRAKYVEALSKVGGVIYLIGGSKKEKATKDSTKVVKTLNLGKRDPNIDRMLVAGDQIKTIEQSQGVQAAVLDKKVNLEFPEPPLYSAVSGIVKSIQSSEKGESVVTILTQADTGQTKTVYTIPAGRRLAVQLNAEVKKGQPLNVGQGWQDEKMNDISEELATKWANYINNERPAAIILVSALHNLKGGGGINSQRVYRAILRAANEGAEVFLLGSAQIALEAALKLAKDQNNLTAEEEQAFKKLIDEEHSDEGGGAQTEAVFGSEAPVAVRKLTESNVRFADELNALKTQVVKARPAQPTGLITTKSPAEHYQMIKNNIAAMVEGGMILLQPAQIEIIAGAFVGSQTDEVRSLAGILSMKEEEVVAVIDKIRPFIKMSGFVSHHFGGGTKGLPGLAGTIDGPKNPNNVGLMHRVLTSF